MALDVNSTILNPVVSSISYLVNLVKLLVGGIFGIYIILVILRWRETKKMTSLLKEIRDDIKKMNKKLSKK